MIVLDVNVLVTAIREAANGHEETRTWLNDAVNGDEAVGVSDAALAGALRILTHPRVFDPPSSPGVAIDRLTSITNHPNVSVLPTTSGQWRRTCELALAADARGNLVADAAHAAHAIEHGATFVTRDRDFARFDGLRWRVPD